MNKIVYISPMELSGLNSISEMGNSKTFLNHLAPIDYHFMLFSALYQSGTNYFQLNTSILPQSLKENTFWREKFIDIDRKPYEKALLKASKVLENNFDVELDNRYSAPMFVPLHCYLTSLFYSADTGNPFINVDFAEKDSFNFLQTRLSSELFATIKNFNSLVVSDKISTVTPQYSVLLKDVKRFEDITTSVTYRNYSASLGLLTESTRIEAAKKEIQINALKLYNKYAKHVDLKSMSFSFLRFNKKIAELFINKPASAFGDYLIDVLERSAKEKKKIYFYKVDEAHYMLQWANRIGELMRVGGKDKLGEFLANYKK